MGFVEQSVSAEWTASKRKVQRPRQVGAEGLPRAGLGTGVAGETDPGSWLLELSETRFPRPAVIWHNYPSHGQILHTLCQEVLP